MEGINISEQVVGNRESLVNLDLVGSDVKASVDLNFARVDDLGGKPVARCTESLDFPSLTRHYGSHRQREIQTLHRPRHRLSVENINSDKNASLQRP